MSHQNHLPFKYSKEAEGQTEFKKCDICGTDEMHEYTDGEIVDGKLLCHSCYETHNSCFKKSNCSIL